MAVSERLRRRQRFGHAVRQRREELGWSQIRLAEEISAALEDRTVTQGAVSKWEGGLSLPQRDKLPTIERVLKLESGALSAVVDGTSVVVADRGSGKSASSIAALSGKWDQLSERDRRTVLRLVDEMLEDE